MWNLNVQNEVEIRRACCFLCAGFLYNMYPLMGSKTPPQNLAKAKKLGGDQLPIKARLVKADYI